MNKKLKLLRHTVTIDPGLHTGIARWNGTAFPKVTTFMLPKKTRTLEERLRVAATWFEGYLLSREGVPRTAIIEGVEIFDTLKSMTAAKRGDISWLAYLVGVYTNIAWMYGLDVRIITARQWKGQLSKKGTVLRVKRINGQVYPNDHTTDAVAMGFAMIPEVWKLREKII